MGLLNLTNNLDITNHAVQNLASGEYPGEVTVDG